MTFTPLSGLTDKELLRHVENECDPLTSTDAEVELVKRFARMIELEDRLAIFDEFQGLDIRSLLDAITAAGIDTAEQLNERLAIADQFDGIAIDAGDLFARLNTLIATAQE